ncbi:MAG: malate synthase [Thermoleophilia bacterium]|nr:malate synthase [Thermoleophilia bacterium]MCZ4497341.1 malate synthase [Thermoleophilia bacterium]
MANAVASLSFRPAPGGLAEQVLDDAAQALLLRVHERFQDRRIELLAARTARQERLDAGELPDFLPSTADVRAGDWTIAPTPAGLQDRRTEITGPVERKMVINALNSGAKMFMADFEDANAPTWRNCLEGQLNLTDAINGDISLTTDAGKEYRLPEDAPIATLLVRPRGWHLDERHVTIDGVPISGGLFDATLYVLRNHEALAARGWGPWLYLPKLESHLEARLWNDVFSFLEAELGLHRGTIRATVLIETILAAFEMDEILYELREHAAGLNAGRWDYIFSTIKRLRANTELPVLPDRVQVTMGVPFMRAYAELLVQTCHRRGAHAMGGMAALIPSRRDAEANERALAAVREDKRREAEAGFDGTWVAHPDLVPVALEQFDAVLGDRPNQLERQRDDVSVDAAQLLDLRVPGGAITAAGVHTNVRVGVAYLAAWLTGSGAVAIDNLMEDAATAEISRSQLWQWVQRGAQLEDGRTVTAELVRDELVDVIGQLRAELAGTPALERLDQAAAIFARVALETPFIEFLTLPAYEALD